MLPLVGLLSGIGIIWGATYIHEAAHWLFIVPFGGSVHGWQWMPPGWFSAEPASGFSEAFAFYAGGIGAGVTLLLILGAFRHFGKSSTPLWWMCGAVAFGAPMEIIAGIFEGADTGFYNSGWFLLLAVLLGIGGVVIYLRSVPYPQKHQEAR